MPQQQELIKDSFVLRPALLRSPGKNSTEGNRGLGLYSRKYGVPFPHLMCPMCNCTFVSMVAIDNLPCAVYMYVYMYSIPLVCGFLCAVFFIMFFIYFFLVSSRCTSV